MVIPVLMYNAETWGVTQATMEKLDSFHRRQLRHLIGVHHPNPNEQLYQRCQCQPLSIEVEKRRMRMTGHILRMNPTTPPHLAMSCYLAGDAKGNRGRPKKTLATTVQSNLAARDVIMKKPHHLQEASMIATNKVNWRKNVVNKC